MEIARQLKLTKSAVYQWGAIVPLASAQRLEHISQGALLVDESLYESNRPIRDYRVEGPRERAGAA